MIRWFAGFGAVVAACLGVAAAGASPNASAPNTAAALPAPVVDVRLPFTRTVLPNGLTVIFHEDHALPVVVIDTSWDVGSRHEVPGRTGFAHLFEHLMFTGTARVPNNSFDLWMEQVGASNNASTTEDVTEYHAGSPSHVLPLLLWLEADRIADFGHGITQPKLDAQRDVVRNERRETSENTPYGEVELYMPELLYPAGHPYHHPVIGSHEDLANASLEDVRGFFDRFYDPARASLVVAGDFDPTATMSLVKQWFAGIPSRQGGHHERENAIPIGPLTSIQRRTVTGKVELAKLVMAWRTPKEGAPGERELEVLLGVLGQGKTSRLYRRLVYERKLAQALEVAIRPGVLGSDVVVDVIAQPGVSLDVIEREINKELAQLRSELVTADELQRAKNDATFQYVRELQSILARATALNRCQRLKGDPGCVPEHLDGLRAVTAEALRSAAVTHLPASGYAALRILPESHDAKRNGP